MKRLILILTTLCIAIHVNAQRKTEIGITGGAIRFYPEAQHLGSNLNNRMDNGWGFSAGIFAENHLYEKFHPVVEFNYYNISSDVFLQRNPEGPWAPNDGTGREPIIGDYKNTSFGHVAVSAGFKYFLKKRLFVYPGFELAQALNEDVDENKTTYNLKFGAGFDFSYFKAGLEYSYGLNYQRIVYDYSVPFASTHRNKFLQLKIQVPVYILK